jgi:hypothetical protein
VPVDAAERVRYVRQTDHYALDAGPEAAEGVQEAPFHVPSQIIPNLEASREHLDLQRSHRWPAAIVPQS